MAIPSQLPASAELASLVLGLVLTYVVLARVLAALGKRHADPMQEWRAAERRAEAMLAEMLAPQEIQRLRQRGYLEVASQEFGDRVYRIPRYQGPVAVYQDGVLINLLCLRSVEPIPNADAVLMHKLLLEADESGYLKVANSIRPRPYSYISS